MLQWARTNGAPWCKYTCTFAAQGGHLEMLQWARANGCPWDEETRGEAKRRGFDVEALDQMQTTRTKCRTCSIRSRQINC